MSCICSADGGYGENRISLALITIVATATATAANTAIAGGSLELQECSDPALTGYWA
jgi:hypothetical protein